MSVHLEIGPAAYQRVSIKVLVFRIPSETYCLLDSSGDWEPFVIANCPAICGDLVGLDACEILNPVDRFTEAGPPLTDFLRQPLNLAVLLYNLLAL